MKRFAFLTLLFTACHATNVPSVKQPDGSWSLKCGNSLDLCVQRANDLCDNRGFVVLGGRNDRKLYGAELGQSQVEVREAELSIACADRRGDLPKVLTTNTLNAPPSAPAALPMPAPGPTVKGPASACTPGSTQRCVGAGACAGGQACIADGSGFTPCDCGTAAPHAP